MSAYNFTVISLLVFITLYFTSVRCLNNIKSIGEKTREFLQFLLHYAVVLVVIVLALCIVQFTSSKQSWQINLVSVAKVAFFSIFFYFAPSFLLAYFLYPFKFISKKRQSKWVIAAAVVVFLICTVLFFIGLSFSNM